MYQSSLKGFASIYEGDYPRKSEILRPFGGLLDTDSELILISGDLKFHCSWRNDQGNRSTLINKQ